MKDNLLIIVPFFLLSLVSEGPEGVEEQQPRYLDQERLAFVQSYLEKAEDARSMRTETSDSGMPGTNGASSELGMEEAKGKNNLIEGMS